MPDLTLLKTDVEKLAELETIDARRAERQKKITFLRERIGEMQKQLEVEEWNDQADLKRRAAIVRGEQIIEPINDEPFDE